MDNRCWMYSRGWDKVFHPRKTIKDGNSHPTFCLQLFPCPFSTPQGWSIISLNMREAALRLKHEGWSLISLNMLEPALICWHSKSFSMASLKGLLSILFPFHYLLPVSSTKEITTSYLATRRVWEVSHVPCSFLVPSKEIEKCYRYI